MFWFRVLHIVYLIENKTMKKSLSIVLTIVYLVLVSGITLQLHYCGGKFRSLNLVLDENSPSCACGSKTMKKGCCKNQTVYIKVKGDQKSSNNSKISFDDGKKTAFQRPSFTLNLSLAQYVSTIINYHAPPPRYNNSLLIFNSSFRI